MSNPRQDSLKRMKSVCKDCGDSFVFPVQAAEHDIAIGSSVSTRCPKCRAAKKQWSASHPVAYVDNSDYLSSVSHDGEISFGLGHEISAHSAVRTVKSNVTDLDEVTANFAKVAPYVEAIVDNLNDPRGKRVSLLIVPTGWGKSTWLPYRIMMSPLGARARVLVTQPRTSTMKGSEDGNWQNTLPGFISSRLLASDGIGAGQHIGLQYRGESKMHDQYNKLVFVTDGICIQYLKNDTIDRFQVLVIDEAHEQSANMELIFALLKEKLIRYPNLRVVIASATIDPKPFIAYYGGPSQVLVSGPDPSSVDTKNLVVDRYPSGDKGFAEDVVKLLGKPFTLALGKQNKDLPDRVADLVKCIRNHPEFTVMHEPFGDILVFMPTIALVDLTVEAVTALKLENLEVLSCHAQMDDVEAQRFRVGQKRAEVAAKAGKLTVPQRVIVATTYAETSVTFANLKYVIDTGLISEPHWNSEAWYKDQRTRVHTQAGCWQRRGRVGRTGPGEVFHLYEEEDFRNPDVFRKFPLPEVRRSRLDSVILTLAVSGVPYDHLSFLGEQGDDAKLARKEMERAIASLHARGVFDEQGDPTEYGLLLEGLETSSIEAAAFISESSRFACSLEAATFLAFFDSPIRPFLRDSNGELAYARWRQGCSDDLELYMRIYHHWEQAGAKDITDNAVSGDNGNRKALRQESAQERWAKENGLNHSAFVTIAEARVRLLGPFTRKTHTKTEDRDLDIDRLHKTRFVLVKTLVDWIYVKTDEVDASSGARLYKPLESKWLAASERVTISPEAACFHGPDGPAAFVAMERVQGYKRVTCRYIVNVDLKWVDAIKRYHWLQAGRATDAMLVYSVIQEEASVRDLTASVVKAVPTANFADIGSYSLGSSFNGRVIRSTLDREEIPDVRSTKYLVEDVDLKQILVVQLQGSSSVYVGSCFQAQIISVDAKAKVLGLSQDSLRVRYNSKGVDVHAAKVIEVLKNDFDEADAYRLELEPGVQGICRLRDGEHRLHAVQSIVVGGMLDVIVTKQNNDKIYLRTKAEMLKEEESYYGEVIRLLDSEIGFMVRIGPQQQDVGVLHYSRVPSSARKVMKVGRRIRVSLFSIHMNEGHRRLSLDWIGFGL